MSKRNISYVKPREPDFITKLKEKVGYKEGPNVDTKREKLAVDRDPEEDFESEKPVVVVLKAGDLTAEEAEKELTLNLDLIEEEQEKNSETEPNEGENLSPTSASGRIVFKKPEKRSQEDSISPTSKKPKRRDSTSEMKQVKNKSLLSFNDEENDDNL